jgi:hypothetical protein
MEILKEILSTILTLVGIFTLFYIGGYLIELGKQKVRRKMKVCDNCLEIIRKIQS